MNIIIPETTDASHKDLQQKIIDLVNNAGYNTHDPDELCPDVKVKFDFGEQVERGMPCRNQYLGSCVLLNHKWEYKSKEIDKQFELGFNVYSDEPLTIKDITPDTIGCEMRVKLLELYDKYQASGKNTDAHHNFLRAINQVGTCCITGLLWEHDFYEAEAGKTPYSDKAMEEAYEKWQYEKRRNYGEPVIFRDGRCLFDQAIFSKGIQPGPFPGLEFYMYDEKPLAPFWVREWLDSDEFAGQKNKLPAVGYYGRALCAVHFSDLLQYYVWRHSVYGPETYRAFLRQNPSWTRELFHHAYNVF